MSWRESTLSGWGRSSAVHGRVARPERLAEVAARLAEAPEGGLIAYGAGRSYGDPCLNDGGAMLLTERLDRMLAFDPDTAELVAEAGVTYADLLSTFLPRGFLPAVSPGTSFVTLGGALANDVHGKNQEHAGCFGDHLLWFDLLLPSDELRRVTAQDAADLFRATLGGVGLTGLVTTLCLRLAKVPSNAVDVEEQRIGSLEAFLAAFADGGRAATYSVGWIDALARGRSLGRGVLETAEPSAQGVAEPADRRLTVPLDLPGFALNGTTVSLFNELYWRRIPRAARRRRRHYRKFLYPLDALHRWNRLYGKRGFRQFQCVLPHDQAEAGLPKLLQMVSARRAASPLAVIKAMGRAGLGHLSFARPGITLALDLPNRPGLDEVMAQLEAMTLDHGGRLYLAKDSCMGADGFARMYPALNDFRRVRAEVDPERRLRSDLARRLQLQADPA